LLKLLAAIHCGPQLLGPWTGDPLGVVFALPPDLMFVIRTEGMVRVDSPAIFRLKRAVLHEVDLGHLLEYHLALLDEFAHEQSIV